MSAIFGGLAVTWTPGIFFGLPLVVVIAAIAFLVVRRRKSK